MFEAGSFFALSALWTIVAQKRLQTGKRPRTYIKNYETYNAKREAMLNGGVNDLLLVLDFDRTITSYNGPRGGRGASCHGIIESGPQFHETLRAQAETYNAFYYPIEIDPGRTKEEKIPYMNDWYRNVNELIVESGITKQDLVTAVANANVDLRPGMVDIFHFARKYDVPLLIFSAGIGDVIAEVLEQKYCQKYGTTLPRHTQIVSNWMIWETIVPNNSPTTTPSSNPKLIGWSEPVIHMFNKDAGHTRTASWFNFFNQRKHVILLGDGEGDITMSDGLAYTTVLKLGFLNDHFDKLLTRYTDTYDIVITHDGPATIIMDLLKEIREQGAKKQ